MGFWDHVGELRYRLIWSLLAIVTGAIATFLVYDWLLTEFFLPPYCRAIETLEIDRPCTLIITAPLDGFRTRIMVSLYLGAGLATPVLAWHLWRFITPALSKREKRWAPPFIVAATLLFALGAAVAYLALERALEFLISVAGSEVDPLLTPGAYLGLITFMLLAFGLGFEFPVVLVFAQLVGVIKPRQLHRARRYAIVAIVAVAAIITPSGDPITLATLAVPMYVFYEMSIVVGHLLTRRRRQAADSNRADQAADPNRADQATDSSGASQAADPNRAGQT